MTLRPLVVPGALVVAPVPAQALLSALNPLRKAMTRKVLDTRTRDTIAAAAFGNVARKLIITSPSTLRNFQVGGVDYGAQVPLVKNIGAYLLDRFGVVNTDPESEPFIVVKMTTYPLNGSASVVRTFSDIDRPVGRGIDQMSLDGRVLEVGYIGRRLAPSNGIARINCSIKLANQDGALNSFFRSPDLLRTRFDIKVGFRSLPPAFYRRVAPLMQVDRVTAITPEYVELSLIDATDGIFGVMTQPPTKASVVLAPGTFNAPSFQPNDKESAIPVPIGREWVKAFLWKIVGSFCPNPPPAGTNWNFNDALYTYVYCLGCSKVPHVFDETDMYSVQAQNIGSNSFELARLDDQKRMVEYVGPQSVCYHTKKAGFNNPFIGKFKSTPHVWLNPATQQNETWYIATFELTVAKEIRTAGPDYVNRPTSQNQNNYGFPTSVVNAYNIYDPVWGVDGLVPLLYYAAKEDALWCRWPYGAGGSRNVDPVSIIWDLCQNYMVNGTAQSNDATPNLDWQTFDAVRNSFSLGAGQNAGGTFKPGDDGASVISAVAKSHHLDLWWAADGKLHIAAPWPDQLNGLLQMAGSRVYDANFDIIKGSFIETIPLGSERHGLVNAINITGLKDYAAPASILGYTGDVNWSNGMPLRWSWGRVLQMDDDWTWITSAFVYAFQPLSADQLRVIESPNMDADAAHDIVHSVAAFNSYLHALELECAEFIRVLHWAGSQQDGGYQYRSFRVEEVGLDWSGKRVKVVAVDANDFETGNRGVFDREDRWYRIARYADDGVLSITLNGTTTVQFNGATFRNVGIKVGNFIRIQPYNGSELENLQITSIANLASLGQVTVSAAAAHSGTYKTFIVERDHADPPGEADFPGRYPTGAQMYFRAANEATGLFPNGDPAFKAERATR